MANEKNTVREFISAVLEKCQGFKKVTFFAILDNMSKDGTIDIIKDLDQEWPQLKFIWAPENRCVVDAYMRGYQEAMKAGCNWILEIDAGFSHQPSEISRFFVEMGRGYDCVFGSRFCKGGKFKNFTLRRFLISKGGTLLTNLMLGTKLKDMTSGFELFSHATMQMILDKGIQSRGHFFQTEIRVFCRNLNIIEIPISYSNPSYSVDFFVIKDAFSNLWRLFKLRLRGQL
jgi:dolichol-phosphate mannosyltransferase